MCDVDTLTAEALELHRDALRAARAARLCQVAAGQRLLEVQGSMTRADWDRWVRRECPIGRRLLGEYLAAALGVPDKTILAAAGAERKPGRDSFRERD